MIIYIDVLLAINLYINYFLIRGTAVFLRRSLSVKRTLIAAGVGSLFSLVILLPELPFYINFLIRLITGCFIVYAAYGYDDIFDYTISLICFLVMGFLYAGIMLGIWVLFAPFGMYYRNGTTYFNIPIIAVGAFTAIAYFIVRLMRRISDNRRIYSDNADVVIITNGEKISVDGTADTGNSLCDPFSGKPVIIVTQKVLGDLIPQHINEYLKHGSIENIKGIRLIPCRTINGCSVIPVFKPDKITVNGKSTDAVVGVLEDDLSDIECLFNPKLIHF